MAYSLTSSGLTLDDSTFKNKKDIGLAAYPVGSIYMSMKSDNPSTIFGGTWSAIGQGRVLIGAGSGTDTNDVSKSFTVGSTGGEYEHTLTVDEMPSHSHSYTSTAKHGRYGSDYSQGYWSSGNTSQGNPTATFTETGGSQPISI